MNPARLLFTLALLSAVGITPAIAECQIADAKLEEAILQKPELRDPANRQSVRDLRSLRDAAFTLLVLRAACRLRAPPGQHS